jgi:hypothetical protein
MLRVGHQARSAGKPLFNIKKSRLLHSAIPPPKTEKMKS